MKKNEVFDDLRNRIVSGEFAPGDWLVERELSEMYGISRTPIREVLGKLSNLCIVEMQSSKGYQVKKLNLAEIIEIFNAREAIEGISARFACYSKNPNFKSTINELRLKLEALDLQHDGKEGVTVGNQLHNFIIAEANNRYFSEFADKLSALMSLTRNITMNFSRIEEKSRADHLAILNALEERDGEKCEHLMREHLRATCKAIADNYYSHLVGGLMA